MEVPKGRRKRRRKEKEEEGSFEKVTVVTTRGRPPTRVGDLPQRKDLEDGF